MKGTGHVPSFSDKAIKIKSLNTERAQQFRLPYDLSVKMSPKMRLNSVGEIIFKNSKP